MTPDQDPRTKISTNYPPVVARERSQLPHFAAAMRIL
jgi:hypothetical protein